MTQAIRSSSAVQIVHATNANIYTAAKDSVGKKVLTMTEYIERKRAIVEACNSLGLYQSEELCPSEYVKLEDALNNIPAADVAPVRHGRWVSAPHKLARVCSVCNRDEPYKFADIDADVYDYCPNCGAKMDGGNG